MTKVLGSNLDKSLHNEDRTSCVAVMYLKRISMLKGIQAKIYKQKHILTAASRFEA